jgi:hypothetical protein
LNPFAAEWISLVIISTESEWNVWSSASTLAGLARLVGVGLGRGLDEEECLLVRDILLKLELNQRKYLEGYKGVDKRLKK